MTAAAVSMLCCTGPLVLAAAGVSGAALATIAPLRPLFVLAAFVSLWGGFQALDRLGATPRDGDPDGASCEPDRACADPRTVRRMRFVMWVATALTLVLTTSPLWDDFLL